MIEKIIAAIIAALAEKVIEAVKPIILEWFINKQVNTNIDEAITKIKSEKDPQKKAQMMKELLTY